MGNNFKVSIVNSSKKVMISLSPITYFAYFDDYFVSLKDSCHISIILCPCGKYLAYVAKILDFMLFSKV
jgi:hypothetical protein